MVSQCVKAYYNVSNCERRIVVLILSSNGVDIFSIKMQQSRKLIRYIVNTSVPQQARSYSCCQYLRLHSTEWLDDWRIMDWKEFGRKQ
jgi:hypothetical protein